MIWQHAIETITKITLTPKKQVACPMCGGSDRFVYDDEDKNGTWFCRKCGGRDQNGGKGNGFELIKRVLGCDYAKAVELVHEYDHGAAASLPPPAKPAITQVFPATLPAPEAGKKIAILSAKTGVTYHITPEMVTPITTRDSALMGWVVRYMGPGDRKVTPQITQVAHNGKSHLCAMGVPEPRPVLVDWATLQGKAVLIVEGEKTQAAALRLFPDYAVATWIGGAQAVSKTDWGQLVAACETPGSSPEIYILPDNDDPGKKAAAEIAARTGGVVVQLDWQLYPEKWDVADPLPDGVPQNAVHQAISKAAEAPPGVVTISDKPLDLLGGLEPPDLPVGLVPPVIARFCMDQAAIMGVDPSIMVASALVTLASVLTDDITLQPKTHERHWQEPARLWAAVVAEPAARKTPAMLAVLRPLRRIDKAQATEHAAAMAEHMELMRAHKALPPKERARSEEPKPPPEKRVRVNGTTIEALEKVLEHNPRGVLCEYDELAGWFGRMDAYSASGSGSKDRPAWLELYNGGMRRSDTVSRGSLVIPNWSACVLGAIQPDAFRKIADKLPTDGLLQRFILIVGRNATEDSDRPCVQRFADDWDSMIRDLYAMDWTDAKGHRRPSLYLSEGAAAERKAFSRWSHGLLECGAVRGPMAGAVGKWDGLWARLAVVYHMAMEWDRITIAGSEDLPALCVPVETARMVSGLIRQWILPHAMIVYQDILGSASGDDLVRSVARLLLVWDAPEVTSRMLTQRCRDWRSAPEYRRHETARALEDAGWLIELERRPGERMASRWRVSEQIIAAYAAQAEAERVRRGRAREVMAGLRGAGSAHE
jgi:ribosomal protein L37AE/L43A